MAEQKTKEKPYEKRVREVIEEELLYVPDDSRRGSEDFEAAIGRIVTRLAADMVNLDRQIPSGPPVTMRGSIFRRPW